MHHTAIQDKGFHQSYKSYLIPQSTDVTSNPVSFTRNGTRTAQEKLNQVVTYILVLLSRDEYLVSILLILRHGKI